MIFDKPMLPAKLIKRYKRFLADVRLEDGTELTVHCPNPGAMLGLHETGNRVWISDSQNPKRKLQYTLELMEVQGPEGLVLVGINTMHPNKLAREAIEAGRIPQLEGYSGLRPEVKYGENSRIDMLLTEQGRPDCYVEVKNCHLVRTAGLHEFPDCKTARGAKHLGELEAMVRDGHRAVMLFVVQRKDGDRLSIAADLDPAYDLAFKSARRNGVEALAIRCDITTEAIIAKDMIEVLD